MSDNLKSSGSVDVQDIINRRDELREKVRQENRVIIVGMARDLCRMLHDTLRGYGIRHMLIVHEESTGNIVNVGDFEPTDALKILRGTADVLERDGTRRFR